MRLYQLTLATIFRRKAWAICAFAVGVLPFALPWISSATEKPILVQPARIQAAWALLWVSALVWGLFTAAKQGEDNAKSGIGEYFQTTGLSPTRQLLEIWLAVISFIIPLALLTAIVCLTGAMPANPAEKGAWWLLNAQYVALFLLAVCPLVALAIALSSRFGSIAGFVITAGLALYGLYGVGYLDNMLKLEANPFLQGIWLYSPHYHLADLTQRLYFKSGALTSSVFWQAALYFTGILAVYSGISRLSFRTKLSS
ncbi:MAG: hypothetical protein QM680_12220 [Luteolibacter sp.]